MTETHKPGPGAAGPASKTEKQPGDRTLVKFEPTNVPCLFRRKGPNGDVYYGRLKRHGKFYLKKMGEDFKESKAALRKWITETEVRARAAANDPGPRPNTWGQYKEKYLRTIDLDPALADKSKTYRHECVGRIVTTWRNFFEEEIEDRKITSITQEECLRWAASITWYYVGTYNNTISTMKHIFREAVDAGYLLASPAAKLRRVGKLKRFMGCSVGEVGEMLTREERELLELADEEEHRWYPSPKEFREIIAKMRSYRFGPVKAAADFAELLACTGCRLSEANRLRWRDVDWTKNRLRINGAKGRAASTESDIRYVPILDELRGLLRRLEKADPNRQPTDKIATVSECRGTMQRACVDLELPRKLDHHDLRHWFATRMVGEGVPVPVVAKWLGHKDGGALLIKTYHHDDEDVSRQWAGKVRLFRGCKK